MQSIIIILVYNSFYEKKTNSEQKKVAKTNKQTHGKRAISRKYNGPNIKICGTFLAQFLPVCKILN